MKVGLPICRAPHQTSHMEALASGLARLGHKVQWWEGYHPPTDVDVLAGWGWRKCHPLTKICGTVLVLERGYIADRFEWTSLGWNGLNGRAVFPDIGDPSRWRRHFQHLRKPWRRSEGYALVMGQVSDDAALWGVDIATWYQRTVTDLVAAGWDVRFRPHPVELQKGRPVPSLIGAKRLGGELVDAIAGAGIVATYNSNSGVDAALAGVPVYAQDIGSMAWPVAFKSLTDPKTFNRAAWCNRLAWKQWRLKEIASGEALEIVLAARPLTT
jgi:hypothetical protein